MTSKTMVTPSCFVLKTLKFVGATESCAKWFKFRITTKYPEDRSLDHQADWNFNQQQQQQHLLCPLRIN